MEMTVEYHRKIQNKQDLLIGIGIFSNIRTLGALSKAGTGLIQMKRKKDIDVVPALIWTWLRLNCEF
jgi:hypothetical protein